MAMLFRMKPQASLSRLGRTRIGDCRGELCGTRWRHVDLANGVLHVQRAIGQYGKTTWEKDTKNEGDRRIVLDPDTVLILSEHRERWSRRLCRRLAGSSPAQEAAIAATGARASPSTSYTRSLRGAKTASMG